MVDNTTPLLRTLSPALRGLDRSMRAWLDGRRTYPMSTIGRATLEGLSTDLKRQAEALDVDRPLLVIVLMGGTGVGKSTLLNALAGADIAQSSFARPTTRDPVVYYHESLKPDRLDPALRHCRLAPHDRESLEHKILVDTPDLDSNDLSNREKLMHILPVADIVLYVGSQEKYHDKLGWELFLEQRKRRAFAFVLNKWDRCLHAGGTGVRPDEDLIHDLEQQGFVAPLVYRTCARHWLQDAADNEETPLPEGEQFQELVAWLEMGLTRLEIEAIKSRGVSQMLSQLEEALHAVSPPDLSQTAAQTKSAWQEPLEDEAKALTEILLNTLDPYQREIEHHFALEGQKRFRGIMAGYLAGYNRLKYLGSSLKERLPLMSSGESKSDEPSWDLGLFTRACGDASVARQMEARGKALANHLLVEADRRSFPLDLLSDPVEEVAQQDWRSRFAQSLSEVLQKLEQEWTRPSGGRKALHSALIFVADWVPLITLLGAVGMLLWRYFDLYDQKIPVQLSDVLLPFVILLSVLVLLHILIAVFMPLRWPVIRGEFAEALQSRLLEEMESAYLPVPNEVASRLLEERKQIEKIVDETRDVAGWLKDREETASVTGMYGN